MEEVRRSRKDAVLGTLGSLREEGSRGSTPLAVERACRELKGGSQAEEERSRTGCWELLVVLRSQRHEELRAGTPGESRRMGRGGRRTRSGSGSVEEGRAGADEGEGAGKGKDKDRLQGRRLRSQA